MTAFLAMGERMDNRPRVLGKNSQENVGGQRDKGTSMARAHNRSDPCV